MLIALKVYTGVVRRFGFGGPWQRGKKTGQMSLFMIWDEEWFEGDVDFARVVFNSKNWIGF
jgi:hypothetical protein